jgi:uncharacterized UPF0160 family protein
MKKKRTVKKLVTHDGSFHSDDVFAAAALSLFLKRRKEKFKIIRTRDEKIIKAGDYVFDVGGIYNPKKNFFDHHQRRGAGQRKNGIPYSSFGLVWKKFGPGICSSKAVAEMIDRKLVGPVDAEDSGFDLAKSIGGEAFPYTVQNMINAFLPTWREKKNQNEIFPKLAQIAKTILLREIKVANDLSKAQKIFDKAYQKSKDKKIVVLNRHFTRDEFNSGFEKFPRTVFVIYPRSSGEWKAESLRKSTYVMTSKKNFPKIWAGLRNQDLQKVSEVPDAIFCHRGLFLAVAKSKKGAIRLAELALKK